jgi:hypothetical protein
VLQRFAGCFRSVEAMRHRVVSPREFWLQCSPPSTSQPASAQRTSPGACRGIVCYRLAAQGEPAMFPMQTKNLRRLYRLRVIAYVVMTVIGFIVLGVHLLMHR